MSHPIRNPQARKIQVGISLSLAALDMADAVAQALDHPTRSALLEALIRQAADEHLGASPDRRTTPEGSVRHG